MESIETIEKGPRPPAAYIGLDWGHKEHAIAMEADGKVEECILNSSAESVHQWFKGLGERFKGQPVVLGVETSRGPIINALQEYGSWLTVYPINPVTSARYRKAFALSGAKDDGPDALVLLELVRDHSAKLRAQVVIDAPTAELEALVELRRNLVDGRSQLSNRLDSLLKSYYPQALKLMGEKDSAMAMAFLQRWPDLLSVKRSKPNTLRSFYYQHNSRSPKVIEERLELVKTAVALTTDEIKVTVGVLKLKALLEQIQSLNRHIKKLDKRIAGAFKAHPERHLFGNLPGAGAAMAPRLCAAFGSDRSRYPDHKGLQKLAGVAPVREKSGERIWTHWRWQAPKFLRQTFVEWAGLSIQYSTWASEYHRQMKAKGKSRQVILRALAFKWIRVLWKCWQDNVPYDEAKYLQQLLHRNSIYAPSE